MSGRAKQSASKTGFLSILKDQNVLFFVSPPGITGNILLKGTCVCFLLLLTHYSVVQPPECACVISQFLWLRNPGVSGCFHQCDSQSCRHLRLLPWEDLLPTLLRWTSPQGCLPIWQWLLLTEGKGSSWNGSHSLWSQKGHLMASALASAMSCLLEASQQFRSASSGRMWPKGMVTGKWGTLGPSMSSVRASVLCFQVGLEAGLFHYQHSNLPQQPC